MVVAKRTKTPGVTTNHLEPIRITVSLRMTWANNKKEETTMKNVLMSMKSMGIMLFAIVSIMSCSNDENIVDEPTVSEETLKSYTLTVEAAKAIGRFDGYCLRSSILYDISYSSFYNSNLYLFFQLQNIYKKPQIYKKKH